MGGFVPKTILEILERTNFRISEGRNSTRNDFVIQLDELHDDDKPAPMIAGTDCYQRAESARCLLVVEHGLMTVDGRCGHIKLKAKSVESVSLCYLQICRIWGQSVVLCYWRRSVALICETDVAINCY